jgi:hypothetical protein
MITSKNSKIFLIALSLFWSFAAFAWDCEDELVSIARHQREEIKQYEVVVLGLSPQTNAELSMYLKYKSQFFGSNYDSVADGLKQKLLAEGLNDRVFLSLDFRARALGYRNPRTGYWW